MGIQLPRHIPTFAFTMTFPSSELRLSIRQPVRNQGHPDTSFLQHSDMLTATRGEGMCALWPRPLKRAWFSPRILDTGEERPPWSPCAERTVSCLRGRHGDAGDGRSGQWRALEAQSAWTSVSQQNKQRNMGGHYFCRKGLRIVEAHSSTSADF